MVRIGIELGTALVALHSHGRIHRDIKPSNIVYLDGTACFVDVGLVTDLAGRSTKVSRLG